MFVLSKNVGKACRRLASQSKEPLSLLQEALEHFDYALGVINQCSLRDVLGGYKTLYCSVRRVEMERGRVVKQVEGIQAREEESEQVETTKRLVECTTCCGNSEEMVLDENDGCYYCQTCYEEYYAAERGTKEEVVSELRIERKESWKEAGASGDNGEYEEGEKEDAPAGVEPSLDEPKEQEEAQERLRHSRVELGSLADFLAGAESPPFAAQARILSHEW
ncbi:hypothetical protein BBJ29_008291 [Phytophthora kernoviae]|uniref:Uncharacterized protein n=1 Tax=Phytophthora kernoviae TaxID=325452 RepID=A0A3F2RF62_9STRA|nr:hypothetical protein BBP00_00008555 [Phytophthora kernoviae]RLN65581.1 hypothetical protein BBJ29_008291 [Phytophthora kernoviae]